MSIYNEVFNRATIHDSLFLNVSSVLEYETLDVLKAENPDMYNVWIDLCGSFGSKTEPNNEYYQRYGPYYPEFSKIVGVTYAVLEYEEGKLKKKTKRLVNSNEFVVLKDFFDVLYGLSSDGSQSTPTDFKTLTGYNLVYYDIPFLIKRFLLHKNNFDNSNKELPLILKYALNSKPWESGIVMDLANVWGFKGKDIYSLDLISKFLRLRVKNKVLERHEVSQRYWKEYHNDESEALKEIVLSGNTNISVIVQAFNYLRTV